jgi:hypothetical protein
MASSSTGETVRRGLNRPLLDLAGAIAWGFIVLFFFVGIPWIVGLVPPLWIQLLSLPAFLVVGVLPWWTGRRHNVEVVRFIDALSPRVNRAKVLNRWGLITRFDNDLLLHVPHGTFHRAGGWWLTFLRFADAAGVQLRLDADDIDRLWRVKVRRLDRGLDENDPIAPSVERVLSRLGRKRAGLTIHQYMATGADGDLRPLLGAALFVRLPDWRRKAEAIASGLDDIAELLAVYLSRYRVTT